MSMTPCPSSCRTLLLLGLLTVPLALAPAPCGEEKIRISVVAILATDQNDDIDPKLKDVAKEVRKVDPKWTGFRIAKMTCKSLPVGNKDDFVLVADQVAAVAVEHGADKDDRVQLKLTPPMMGEITYRTTCGKFFPVITPYRTKDDELLIVAVRVQPCNNGGGK